jgi:hypothetical protein
MLPLLTLAAPESWVWVAATAAFTAVASLMLLPLSPLCVTSSVFSND